MIGSKKNYTIIDGKAIASDIKEELKRKVEERIAQGKRAPYLVAVLIGHDGGSETYVNSKMKTCAEIGYRSTLIRYETEITEGELLCVVNRLNKDPEVDGFIVQLPLPNHINAQKIIEAISPEKDVDGFHPINVGRMTVGLPSLVSATPRGILELLKRYNITTEGKHCVVVGRSNIVGRPIAQLLSQKTTTGNATVTCCHSHTKDLKSICKQADILIVAVGHPNLITKDMVKDGAVVIDVGTTRVVDSSKKSGFRICGDVDFENVAPICSFITPVPGGVGPMTIMSLMLNTLSAVEEKESSKFIKT